MLSCYVSRVQVVKFFCKYWFLFFSVFPFQEGILNTTYWFVTLWASRIWYLKNNFLMVENSMWEEIKCGVIWFTKKFTTKQNTCTRHKITRHLIFVYFSQFSQFSHFWSIHENEKVELKKFSEMNDSVKYFSSGIYVNCSIKNIENKEKFSFDKLRKIVFVEIALVTWEIQRNCKACTTLPA